MKQLIQAWTLFVKRAVRYLNLKVDCQDIMEYIKQFVFFVTMDFHFLGKII